MAIERGENREKLGEVVVKNWRRRKTEKTKEKKRKQKLKSSKNT